MKKQYISREQVEHVAWLAKIELSEEEKELFTKQFNEILGYFKKMDKLDTNNVPPTSHVLDLVNVFREDKVKPSLTKEKSIKNAPKRKGRYLKAPKII
ncbi:MAG TPA: Asp-tRNA(Asn)/Glu-tRNA(Gln) amidotransferase subunit GatC [archaeon]|nr:Asp-tRNA(Asn)/Glu-tRNA(Gln) amidotransferase subunit GatC [archaeon]